MVQATSCARNSPLFKSSHQTHGFTAFKLTNDAASCKLDLEAYQRKFHPTTLGGIHLSQRVVHYIFYGYPLSKVSACRLDLYMFSTGCERTPNHTFLSFTSRFVSSLAKMVALRAFIGVATIAALVQVAIGGSFTVGGQNGGWDLSTNLAGWAATQKFTVGDSLSFKYASAHDVLEVSKADYDACAASKPTNTYTGGSTVVKLSSPGKRYFICGIPGHCSQGMKVEIDTVAAVTATPPTAPASAPLSMSSPPTEAPTPSKKPSKAASSKAPSSSPPTISPSSEPSDSDLPVTTSPAPPPRSAANGPGQNIKVAMGFGVGMLLVLAL